LKVFLQSEIVWKTPDHLTTFPATHPLDSLSLETPIAVQFYLRSSSFCRSKYMFAPIVFLLDLLELIGFFFAFLWLPPVFFSATPPVCRGSKLLATSPSHTSLSSPTSTGRTSVSCFFHVQPKRAGFMLAEQVRAGPFNSFTPVIPPTDSPPSNPPPNSYTTCASLHVNRA